MSQKDATHSPVRVILVWVLGSFLFAWGLTTIFPVSFREDDVGYLAWASGAGSWWVAVDPSQGMLFGMFRPVVNLWWLGIFQAAGLNSNAYHAALAVQYGLLLGAFLFAASAIHSRTCGILALGLWLVVFYFLQYVLFWFSGYVHLLQSLFLCLAAGYASQALRGSRGGLIAAIAFHVLAFLTKEPAALILPGIYFGLAVSSRSLPNHLRTSSVLGLVSAAGICWVLLKPGLEGRLGALQAWQAGILIPFVCERWSFYAGFLASGTGKLLWAGFAYGLISTFVKTTDRRAAALTIGGSVLFAATTLHPPSALVALAVVSAIWAFRDLKAIPGLLWFWVPIFAVLLIDFQTRTYLFEASFGAALTLAWALRRWPERGLCIARSLSPRWLVPVVSIVVAILAGSFWTLVHPKVNALLTLTAVRANFSDLLQETAGAAVSTPRVLVPDYGDTGIDWERDVLRAPDERKAALQKTMKPHEFRTLLELLGTPTGNPVTPAGNVALLVLMTNHEMEWWQRLQDQTPIPHEMLKTFERRGQRAALIRILDASDFHALSIDQPEPGSR